MTLTAAQRSARTWGLAAVVLAVAVVGFLGMWRPWSPMPDAVPHAAADSAAEAIVVEPMPLNLPEHPLVLVFGDSWTYGSAASDPTLGYAYMLAGLLDGETVVNGVRGSGYLKPGIDGPAFGERIAALDPALKPDLVIIQGSINDRREGVEGYREAVVAAWDALAARYPDAAIVVLGPAPHVLPVGEATARIDVDLSELAASRGWWYLSPIERQWITTDNYLSVIDVFEGRRHPSTSGHRYLAEKLAAALEEFAVAPVTEAGEAETPPDQ